MLLAVGVLTVAALSGVIPPQTSGAIPTVYEAGHFYAVPETTTGQRLRLVVDTGGGGRMYWILPEAAKRLNLKTRTCQVGNFSLTVANIPNFKPGSTLPPPLSSPCGHALTVQDVQFHNHFDGQLSAGYMLGRVWTFNYPAHRLSVQLGSWRPDASAHAATLGFARNAKGQIENGYPRITIHVDGKPLPMLLDTGATSHPTTAGEKATHAPTVNGYGVTSYITHSVFERWHEAHPNWQIVDNGDDVLGPLNPTRIIKVPKVNIAGWSVGPVWFTERADVNYGIKLGSMSLYMDKPIDGAVGANIFRHFVMTIDYPRGKAYFRCATDCKTAQAKSPRRRHK